MSKPLTISASQIETFTTCPRKWWFEKSMRLPDVPKGYLTFGTVLHAVVERWLRADGLGRDPETGKAVEMYPEGWDTVEERGQRSTISPPEAALIRKLVDKAIADGALERWPGRVMEGEFRLPLIEGVEIVGFLDIEVPIGVYDMKTSKSPQYLKQPGPRDEAGRPVVIDKPYEDGDGTSPNCVAHAQQMLTYGYVHLCHRNQGALDDFSDEPIALRHIQFLKDPAEKNGVRWVEAWVTPNRLRQHWEHVQSVARQMVESRHIEQWTEVPGPQSRDACMAYGGCAFRTICGRTESPELYRLRIEKLIENQGGKIDQPKKDGRISANKPSSKGDTNVSIFAKKNQAATSAATTAPAATVTASAPERVAPWAVSNCTSCKGSGINSKQRPCMICDSLRKKRGEPTSETFNVWNDESGTLQWADKDTSAPAPTPAPAAQPAPPSMPRGMPKDEPAPEVAEAPASTGNAIMDTLRKGKGRKAKTAEPSVVTDQVAQAPASQVTPEVTPEETPEVESEAEETPTPKVKLPPGRPRIGFTLLVHCAPIKGPARQVTYLEDVLARYGALLAKDQGKESYYDLDPFKRREALVRAAPAIAEELGTTMVVARSNDPDLKSLLGGLIPHAATVIEGLA